MSPPAHRVLALPHLSLQPPLRSPALLCRTHLILHVARTHGYSKVMTGDSCTRLAIKLMTSLALGRGAFLAWDTVLWGRLPRGPSYPHPSGPFT